MHLLQAQPGEISDGAEPVDASQTPADIIFISAADTELAALSGWLAELDVTSRNARATRALGIGAAT